MNYWLLKSEPSEYSWQDLCRDKETCWDGVKNRQAINNMRKMKLEDLVFFYHSNTGKAIVGIAEVCKEFYLHEEFVGVVDIRFNSEIKRPIPLKEIKLNQSLKNMTILKQPRLSVSPILKEEWDILINSN